MGWERKRGKLHELNRLLRGATDTTFLPPSGTVPAAPGRRALRGDARRRHPAPDRRRQAARRHDGASAQPAAPRSASRRVVEGYAVLQPRVTPPLPGRSGSLFPAPVVGGVGDRPVRGGGVGCLPGSVRRGLLHRQGHLRHRRLRGGAGGARARERAAEPRPVRRAVRARRPRDRHRAVRERAGELPDGRGAPAPLGARRLAAPALDPARAPVRHRPLEDDRQPPAHAVDAGGVPHAGARMDVAGIVARCSGRLFVAVSSPSRRLLPGVRGRVAAPARESPSEATCARSPATSARRLARWR